MAETTRLYLAGRDKALIVNGSADEVQSALVAGGGAMIRLADDDGDVLIVNPAHVSHLEPGPDPERDMPMIEVYPRNG